MERVNGRERGEEEGDGEGEGKEEKTRWYISKSSHSNLSLNQICITSWYSHLWPPTLPRRMSECHLLSYVLPFLFSPPFSPAFPSSQLQQTLIIEEHNDNRHGGEWQGSTLGWCWSTASSPACMYEWCCLSPFFFLFSFYCYLVSVSLITFKQGVIPYWALNLLRVHEAQHCVTQRRVALRSIASRSPAFKVVLTWWYWQSYMPLTILSFTPSTLILNHTLTETYLQSFLLVNADGGGGCFKHVGSWNIISKNNLKLKGSAIISWCVPSRIQEIISQQHTPTIAL